MVQRIDKYTFVRSPNLSSHQSPSTLILIRHISALVNKERASMIPYPCLLVKACLAGRFMYSQFCFVKARHPSSLLFCNLARYKHKVVTTDLLIFRFLQKLLRLPWSIVFSNVLKYMLPWQLDSSKSRPSS